MASIPEPIRLGAPPGPVLDLLPLGATIHRLEVTGPDGQRRNIVLGHPSVADYQESGLYMGATVGRYANRIAGARFSIDGTEYQLAANDRGNNLHAGPQGFDRRTWEVVSAGADRAVLQLVSPDGDQGFPGTLAVRAQFRVDGDTVTIEYAATTVAPTLVNLSNHVYWNLDGEDAGTIDDHLLTINADRYTPVGDSAIPSGEHAEVSGTPFDFRQPRPIGRAVRTGHRQIREARGIDHNFVIRGSGLRDAAVLQSPASGLAVTLRTDQPGLQVYTGNYLNGSHPGTSGGLYRQGGGIALEPQHFPDSPHHDDWPSTVLRPGKRYQMVMEARIQAL